VIRLVASDLDGTLTDEELDLSPRVRRAIAAAQERDVVVTLATGRKFDFVIPFAHDLGITAPLISYQGGLIQAPDSEAPLYRAAMEPKLVREVLAWRTQHGRHIALYADNDVFIDERRHPDAFYRFMLSWRWTCVDDLSSVLERHTPVRFIVFVEPHEAVQVEAELRHIFGGRMEVVRSHPMLVEGNPLGVSKGNALRRLAAHLSVPQVQVMALGDHDNDASMLAWAGLGVAMGDGSPGVKAVADWIAPPLAEDGAAVAIERFVLDG
jgi:Cof subfamily protein (haloacid dehalogenase superfamily)